MKQFFKFIFASCLGTILAMSLLFLIIFMASMASTPKTELPTKGILQLKLDGITPELTDNVERGQFDFESTTTVGINDIVRLIRNAKDDSNIKGILLSTQSPNIAPATAYYISQVLEEFKNDSDKFVEAYGNYFTQSGYIMASSADTIRLNPNGLIDMRGYGTTIPYFKGFSEKWGIDFDVYHAGKYKSAIEPFYLNKSSAANREQTQEYLGDYQDQLAQVIAERRGLSEARAEQIIIEGLAKNAQSALDLGLVDRLDLYETFEESLQERLDVKKVSLVNMSEYLLANPKRTASNPNRIAVIYAEGEVAGGGEKRGDINMSVYEEVFEKLEKNDKVKAIVLRVNSPGGSAFTSDVFLNRIKDLQAQGKIVVASFGDYAASGGYYIAASADHIITEPTTLTGSIGVFSMMPNMNEFFDKELGIYWDTIGTGEHTFLYSTMINRSPQDNALLMSETERVYAQFRKVVADGRNMSIEAVHEVAQGRVWSGVDAMKTGLVDQIGNIDDAIKKAGELAEIESYKVMRYPVIEKTFWEQMLDGLAETTNAKFMKTPKIESVISNELLDILSEVESACQEPQARLPYQIIEG